jgi:DNA-directed RNA polymerase specialized sigma subunit
LSEHTIIDELEKDANKRSGERETQDFDLWKTWRDSDEDPNHLRPLMGQFRGMIRQQVNRWSSIDMPVSVIQAEHHKQFLRALRTYDPDKGKLGTWVGNHLKKAPQRFLTTYQNPARIVETRTGAQRGIFDNALATLDDQLGREPTAQELSEHLNWALPEVERAMSEGRKALTASSTPYGLDPSTNMPSRATEIARFIKTELSPEEMLVWEHTTGDGGKPQLRPGEIATKLRMSPSKVSRLRNSIAEKIKKYY